MRSLRSLDIANTRIGGMLPSWIENLDRLVIIDVAHCRFHGPLTFNISRLRFLRDVVLSGNSFTGSLPQLLPPSLEVALFQDNSFSGSIPRYYSSRLRLLDISGNALVGRIPASIFGIPSLELFAASLNCLQSELPDSICLATNLRFLYLDGLDLGTKGYAD